MNSTHPKDRSLEPGDPMQLQGGFAGGDPALMLDCLIEEYAHMGRDAAEIRELFEDPGYQATRALADLFGAGFVRRRIATVLSRCGVIRTTASKEQKTDTEVIDV
ncbi:MAG: hypothetical protein ACE5H3_05315 [Planctomycetota bacterium]